PGTEHGRPQFLRILPDTAARHRTRVHRHLGLSEDFTDRGDYQRLRCGSPLIDGEDVHLLSSEPRPMLREPQGERNPSTNLLNVSAHPEALEGCSLPLSATC